MASPREDESLSETPSRLSPRSSWILACLIVAAGIVFRVPLLDRFYLDFDEAMHFEVALESTAAETIAASQIHTHPPLVFLGYHFWLPFAESESALRVPSLVLGCVAQLLAFAWLSSLMGRKAALGGLIFMTFSMPVIHLSAQMRGYTFLWCLVFAALIFYSKFMRSEKVLDLSLHTGLLILCLQTHYSCAWLILTLGICGLIRVAGRTLQRRTVVWWCGSQIVLLFVCVATYFLHIARFIDTQTQANMWDFWLLGLEADGTLQSEVRIIAVQGMRFCRFVGGPFWPLLLIAVPSGVLILASRARELFRSEFQAAEAAVLVIGPFVIAALLLGLRVYPLGPTRHSLWLLPFVVLPIGAVAGRLMERWPRFGTTALTVLALSWIWLYPGRAVFGTRTDQTPDLMRSTVLAMQETIPAGAAVVTDPATRHVWSYYMTPDTICVPEPLGEGYLQYDTGRFRLITIPSFHLFNHQPDRVEEINDIGTVRRDTPYWIVYCGFGQPANVPDNVLPRFPMGKVLHHRSVGDNHLFLVSPKPGAHDGDERLSESESLADGDGQDGLSESLSVVDSDAGTEL
ncbi:MAG: hypothetical protein ACYTGL_06630 [Planctomycetota bacterium]|jgi:hypothetical protein